jgi:hypothetical protein
MPRPYNRELIMEESPKKGFPIFWGCVLAVLAVYLIFKFLAPVISMWIVGRPTTLPLPRTLMFIYTALAILGVGLFVTTSERKISAFIAPIETFLRGGQGGIIGIVRLAVLAAFPLLIGWVTFSKASPAVQSLTSIRVQHPTLPGKFEKLANPFRDPDDAHLKRFAEEKGLGNMEMAKVREVFSEQMLAEGRGLFQINCRPCNGLQANSNGPMAWGFRLRPADFTDPGTIPTVVEPYLFWRINEGAFGLPAESTPWDSAMPSWRGEIPEDDMGKIILADYDIAGVTPRMPEKIH